MKHKYYDLPVHTKDLKETIELAEHLGWKGICIVEHLDKISDFKEFLGSISELDSEIEIPILL